jgi:hypothetical protein
MQLELRHLRYFLAVAENFNRDGTRARLRQ